MGAGFAGEDDETGATGSGNADDKELWGQAPPFVRSDVGTDAGTGPVGGR